MNDAPTQPTPPKAGPPGQGHADALARAPGADALLRIAGRVSIQSFLTDGSLARLCDEMSRLTGVPIWLRDVDGRVVVPRDGASAARDTAPGPAPAVIESAASARVSEPSHPPTTARPWEVWSGEAGARRAYELVGRPFPAGGLRVPEGETGADTPGQPLGAGPLASAPGAPGAGIGSDAFVVPLRTNIGEIGSIVMPADWGKDDPKERRALERAVLLLARTAVESCEGALALQRRVHELDAMFRLSSMLVRARDADSVLRTALDLALDVLALDAGSISMLDDPEGGLGSDNEPPAPGSATRTGPGARLIHRAVVNLSSEWLADQTPLSTGGTLRERALRGDVICVDDLHSDPRVSDPERARREGLVSLIVTGLNYQGRELGLIRLYSRQRRTFTPEECGLLRSIADHAAMVVALQTVRALRERDAQVQRQLRVAAEVQRRMLPRTLPSNPRFDLAGRCAPSFALGGDFYDLFEKDDGALGLAVGDVVGKGVPAALMMSAVRASLRAFASENWRLDEVLRKVNQATVRDTLESEFCTLWCGIVHPETMILSYSAAGHDPAMLLRRDAAGVWQVTDLGSDAMPLGIDPQTPYEVAEHVLVAGDVLVAYTDGLSEARNFDNEAFGRGRVLATLMAQLGRTPEASAAEIIEHLMWSLRQFCGVRMSGDDVTIICARVRA
jgi:sigma-B regulation protein RsbU (phosphoserine phosphatase)